MSKLNIDQKTIKDLFSDKKSDFLIPDYQRPYAWGENECQTLWDDIFSFAIPDGNADNFDSSNNEYFLGPIVTFKNTLNGKNEIIDGQQRLTTLMLLLRAFYSKLLNMQDENTKKTREIIAACIWKVDEFDNPNMNCLKIDSEVSTDDEKEEFVYILKNGKATTEMKSKYADTFRFFEEKINEFLSEYPSYFAFLPNRVLKNCILLPIEAESQDTALRIFSTLNDRGKPLSDTDIFKAQLYKHYSSKSKKDEFVERWKGLELLSEEIFSAQSGSAMDELFTRYMYYLRAKQGNRKTSTEALRKFFEKNNYELLKNDYALTDLEILGNFWYSVEKQLDTVFSERVLKQLIILNYAPNSMWTYFLSVYFMANKSDSNSLDDEKLYIFLNKTIAFIWSYAFVRPGVNALRTPMYPEMVNIINGKDVQFMEYLLDETEVKSAMENYLFTNGRPMTKRTSDLNGKFKLPLIFTQSGTKPMTAVSKSCEYVDLYRNWQEMDGIVIIGFGFNKDDEHINAILRTLVDDDNKNIYVVHKDLERAEVIKRLRITKNMSNINICKVDNYTTRKIGGLSWVEYIYDEINKSI